MAKDKRGLHIQTPQELLVQQEHMLEDLGPGDGANLSEAELLELRPRFRVHGVLGGGDDGSTAA